MRSDDQILSGLKVVGGGMETVLDAIDRRILREVQVDCRIPNQQLAGRVGLSPPACLKRVRRLREAGIIRAETARVDAAALGYPVQVMARVSLERPRQDLIEAFERKVRDLPEVLQCWMVAGDNDFILLVCARSLEDYQRLARTVLAGEPNIRTYSSAVVLSETKPAAPVPVD